jgi:signal transduction histidine kinase/ligand-binding sensor domain-containing protein
VGVVLAGILSPRHADAAAKSCDCYSLTAWDQAASPTGAVLSMAQDSEGYLWLGTSEGLVRFDGFEFARWESANGAALPGLSIPVLVGSRDGSLWLGYNDTDGLTRVTADVPSNYSARDGLPAGRIATLLEDRTGALWAGGPGGLSVLRDGAWKHVAANHGLPDAAVNAVHEDHRGGIWLGTSVGVYYRAPGADVFTVRSRENRFVQSFAEDAGGALWITDIQRIVKRLDGAQMPEVSPDIRLPAGGWRVLSDRWGNVWIAALGGGLYRVDRQRYEETPRVERVKFEHKFAGEGPGGARSIFQDRDGNIWVGTRASGLLRITETSVDKGVTLDGLTSDGVRAITAGRDGSIWIGTFYNLLRFQDGRKAVYDLPQTMALHTDSDGNLWMVNTRGLGRFLNGRFLPEPLPATVRFERITSLTRAPDGAIWLCSFEQGLFRWHEGALSDFMREALAKRPCGFVYADRSGRVWVGFSRGGMATFEHGRFREYTTADGIPSGGIGSIFEDRTGAIWIGFVNGLVRVRDGRLVAISAQNGLPLRIVPSLLEDGEGRLWMGVAAGSSIIRFDPREVDKVAANPRHQIEYTLFDETDGLNGALFRMSRPTAARAGDGRIWLASGNGVVVLDPDAQPAPRRAPQPYIRHVTVDGQEMAPAAEVELPPRTATVRVDYSALDLSQASKVNFRYMLEGFNDEWVDAGHTRYASYMNLRPGHYRFRVSAVKNGAPHQAETAWTFMIRPPFHQTPWFFALCGVGLLLTISGAWWARLRTIRKEFALIVNERARLSRDIHDTLLQSMAAVGLELEVLASHSESEPKRSISEPLRSLRRQVGRCVTEARRSTCELRSPRLEVRDLVEELRQFADDVKLGTTVMVEVAVSGRRRRGSPEVEEQLLRIGQEAISNAIRHSQAELVRITVEYSRDTTVLQVSDTGQGFDVQADRGAEHWGIRNMRERAKRISAQVEITSHPGQGTVVRTVVPLTAQD